MNDINFNFDQSLKIITHLLYLTLICSFTYDYAYLWTLGLRISQIPLTFGDIVNSIFTWAPVVIFVSSIMIFIELLNKRIEQGMTEEEIIQSTSNPELFGRIRAMPIKFIRWAAVTFLIVFFILGQSYFNLNGISVAFMFIVVWGWILEKIFAVPKMHERVNLLGRLGILFFPMIISIFLALGYDDARNQISTSAKTDIVTLNNKYKLSGHILHSFENGLLFKEINQNEIIFLTWSNIQSLNVYYNKRIFYNGFLGNKFIKAPSEAKSSIKPEITT